MRAALAGPGTAAAVHADRELLTRLAAEHHVVTSPHAPLLREYVAGLVGHLLKKLFGWIPFPNLDLGSVAPALELAARLLAWLLLTGALILIVLVILRMLGRGEAAKRAPAEPESSPLPGRPPADPAHWWSRLQAALGAGDVAAALRCLWLWTGFRLAGPALETSWTSSELLRRVGRTDLRPELARLDGWRFGPRPPVPSEVEGLAARLREALP